MTPSLPSIPAPEDAALQLWRRSLSMLQSSRYELERTIEGAMAILPLVPNPLDVIEVRGYGTSSFHQPLPLLMRRHAVSGGLRNRHDPQARVGMDWTPGAPWPADIHLLPAPARLALWLIKAGADPWAPDEEGLDALDWAIQVNSRPLVHALMSHPHAPSVEQIKERRVELWGKSTPWLHYLAHYNAVEVMGDLIEVGFDPLQPDSRGWIPLAWASSEDTVKFLVGQGMPTEDQRKAVSVAWSQRYAKKWNPGEFFPSVLDQALDAVAPLSSKSEDQVAFVRTMEEFLRSSPAKKHYEFAGHLWSSRNNEELKSWVLENEDRQIQVNSGPARGSWEAWTASLWAAIRVEGAGPTGTVHHRQKAFAEAFDERMTHMPQTEREKWLDTPIRPGLSRRGFLTVALGSSRPAFITPQSMPAASIFALVVPSVISLMGKNPGQDWAGVIKSLASSSLGEAYPHLSFAPDSPIWDGVLEMARAGLTAWTQAQASQILDTAIQVVADTPDTPSPVHLKAFEVAMAYLGCKASDWEGKTTTSSESAHAQHQASVWPALVQVMRTRPDVFVPPEEYPFYPAAAKANAGIPSAQAWAAFKEECRLSKVFPESPTPAPRAPRM